MNDRDLKNLFGQSARRGREMAVPDVDALIELARLPHAEEAASPLHADLLRFSRELEPASARLGADLAAALGAAHPVAAHRRATPRRAAIAPRRWRLAAAAMAASLVAAFVLFSVQRDRAHTPATASTAAAVPDRIFAGFDEHRLATGGTHHGDEIFRANFVPDEIFNSSKPHEG
ncbi:MAG: hypothetical protein JSS28_05600 [Proteobacteria bacterium]|nr:hypothetical protein [Pseudomonadota bacterium]